MNMQQAKIVICFEKNILFLMLNSKVRWRHLLDYSAALRKNWEKENSFFPQKNTTAHACLLSENNNKYSLIFLSLKRRPFENKNLNHVNVINRNSKKS